MNDSTTRFALFRDVRKRFNLPARMWAGLILASLVVAASTFFAYRSLQNNEVASTSATRTLAVIRQLTGLLSDVKDAETGQRGYLLTGQESYLGPYSNALASIPSVLSNLRTVVFDSAQQHERLATLEPLVKAKVDELAETVALRRKGDAAAALAIVNTDRGKQSMDAIRTLIAEMQTEERALLTRRQAAVSEAVESAFRYTALGAAILLLLIATAAWRFVRSHRERETEAWLRSGMAGLADHMLGEQRLEALCDTALGFLARYLDVPLGTLYVVESDGCFHRFAGYADDATTTLFSPASATSIEPVLPGEGLLGQVARDNRAILVRNLPGDYTTVRSTIGRGKPRELLVVPVASEKVVHAVIEFGFMRRVEPEDRELLVRVSEGIAVAIRSLREREHVERLLEETQQQAEELQAQQEELRVSNEELEEQGQALKASQVQLETQQAELEQTNSQLEEQTQLLEDQKDALVQSQGVLTDKAAELERSNQFKSEFLANMSHELRTPLNSTLILAKLLADNKHGNLTVEQVKFAETISSAGNDLLTLINDILDLSKIEAGKVEVQAESVAVARLVDALVKTFDPIAKDKGLTFTTTIEPGTPERIETDPQRFAQIARNLLSNAMKFTDKGEVAMRLTKAGDDAIAVAVSDSGIGIPADQQDFIFEAFRQADGSTHRRYGGTGLGLTISRDLARLLGGDIVVESSPGRGSVFTLTLPVVFAGANAASAAPALPAKPSKPDPVDQLLRAAADRGRRGAAATEGGRRGAGVAEGGKRGAGAASGNEAPGLPAVSDDDRDRLAPNARLILVIEDDTRFAAILQDLAHEMGFQCVVTHSAADGLAAAATYRPSAILLDMNLPDHSGLGVLDQLKRNPDTRHIPVHVASVADYSQEARELGAVGYDLKPVKRDQLVAALEGMRARFSQQLRRVLVVEDDVRQLDSIRRLLETDGVQIVGAANASDALAQLQDATFDCMVMDLNLPDFSGYDLLEKMAAREDVAFPPVIVYTGRTLTRDEEQRLGRYSRSIIIKDARSPERLLDEVTLFLHQVEADLPPERQRMLRDARSREATLDGRRVLVVEDDVRNIFALTSVLEPKGLKIDIARNGRESLDMLGQSASDPAKTIDLVLMDIMMPEMDGYTAMREIRKDPRWKKLPIIALTAKAMRDDQEKCLDAGANDYIAKPLDVEKLLSLVRVWMPK